MLKDTILRLYQLIGVIFSTESTDGNVSEALTIISQALNLKTLGFFIRDDEIGIYYPLGLHGTEAAQLKQHYDQYSKSQTSSAQITVLNVLELPIHQSLIFEAGCQFVSLYSGRQCLGIVGFLLDKPLNINQAGDFFSALAHLFSCVRGLRKSRQLENKSNELLKTQARLEQVLRNNMDKQVLIEKMAADLKLEAEKATRANQAKSEFISSMSHELFTPMNAVLGFAQVLEYENLTEEQHGYVKSILIGGYHLLDLIKQVLAFSAIESEQLNLNCEKLSLSILLQSSLLLMRSLAAENQIKIIESLAGVCEVSVFADALRFKQVLLNLLSNAIRFNRPDGSVNISCERVGTQTIRINVIDTGLGLSEQQIEKLFQPFERLSAKNSAIEGAGLGLCISKKLVEAMNGRIGASSVPGEGSCFWIELPMLDAE